MAILGLDNHTKRTVFLFYMGLWCGLRMFVYASKNLKGVPEYNATSLLMFTSVAKLLMSVGLYCKSDGSLSEMFTQLNANWGLFFRYFLPALSYVIYDNLTFVNLSVFDPVTYCLLMQLRMVVTGLMWSAFFGTKLNRNQWIAIILISVGCAIKESGKWYEATQNPKSTAGQDHHSMALWHLLLGLGTIALQIACGVFSSVFNEILLKKQPGVGVNLQNFCMYSHAIICNSVLLMFRGQFIESLSPPNLHAILSPYVLPIGIIMASIGIVTGWFLKVLDSVRKTIASALEIFVDVFLTWILFSIPINVFTVTASVLVSGGVYLYSVPVPHSGSAEGEGAAGQIDKVTAAVGKTNGGALEPVSKESDGENV